MWSDATGRDWSTAINVNTVRRVKDLTGVRLTDAADTDLVEQLYNDVLLLCDVLWAVCQPQAEQRGIDSAAFGELLIGETIDRACESLMRDLVAFFPRGRRERVTKIWAAAQKVETERMKLLSEKMTDEQIETLIQQAAREAGEKIDTMLAERGASSGK